MMVVPYNRASQAEMVPMLFHGDVKDVSTMFSILECYHSTFRVAIDMVVQALFIQMSSLVQICVVRISS